MVYDLEILFYNRRFVKLFTFVTEIFNLKTQESLLKLVLFNFKKLTPMITMG